MNDRKNLKEGKKSSFPPCRTIPEALTFLYLVTFVLLVILGLLIVFLTGFSVRKLAVVLLLLGADLIAFVFALAASRNVPRKQTLKKYRKLLNGRQEAEISELAEKTGLEQEEVLQDLQSFIDQGIYPNGSFSENREYFYPEQSIPQGKDLL